MTKSGKNNASAPTFGKSQKHPTYSWNNMKKLSPISHTSSESTMKGQNDIGHPTNLYALKAEMT